jgi:hypothetical protein
VWGMWLTPKEVEVIGLMISLVSDAYHIAPFFKLSHSQTSHKLIETKLYV